MTNKNVIYLVLQDLQNRLKRQNTLLKTLVILTFKRINYFNMTERSWLQFITFITKIRNLHKACEVVNMKCQSTEDEFSFFDATCWKKISFEWKKKFISISFQFVSSIQQRFFALFSEEKVTFNPCCQIFQCCGCCRHSSVPTSHFWWQFSRPK